LLAVACFRFQSIDEIDDIKEASARAVADESTGNRDGQMALACSRAAGEDDVALVGGEPVGFAIIPPDDDSMGTAQLHRIAVSPPGAMSWRGILQKTCKWVFDEHDIDRLWLYLLVSNTRAARLYQTLGFAEEGIMRASLRTADGRHDLVLMLLLREGWQIRKAKLRP